MGFWGKLFNVGLFAYPLYSLEKATKERDRQAFEAGLRAKEEQTRDKPLPPKWFWEGAEAPPPSMTTNQDDPGREK